MSLLIHCELGPSTSPDGIEEWLDGLGERLRGIDRQPGFRLVRLIPAGIERRATGWLIELELGEPPALGQEWLELLLRDMRLLGLRPRVFADRGEDRARITATPAIAPNR